METGCTKITKEEFLGLLPNIRKQTFKKSSIQSAFRNCGLVPFNPDIVIQQIKDRNLISIREALKSPSKSPAKTPPSSQESTASITTPHRPKEFKKQWDQLLQDSPETKELRLDGLYKGSLAVAHYAQRLKDRLQKNRYAEEIRLKRKALGRKVLKTGGILYAEDVRRI